MALFYLHCRPNEEHYQAFGSNMARNLNNHDLMAYGTFARKTHIPGFSDIDFVLLVNDKAPISQDTWNELREAYRGARKIISPKEVSFQLDIQDTLLAKDGRFVSFDSAYEDNFVEEGVMLTKNKNVKDFLNNYTFFDYKSKELDSYGHNLRKLRLNYFKSLWNVEFDTEEYVKHFESAQKAVLTQTKKLLILNNYQEYEKSRLLPIADEVFPTVDHSVLEKAIHYRHNVAELDKLYHTHNFVELDKIWGENIQYIESLTATYVMQNPLKVKFAEVLTG